MTSALIPCVGGLLDEKVIAFRGKSFSVSGTAYRFERFARPGREPNPFYVSDDTAIEAAVRLIVKRGLL